MKHVLSMTLVGALALLTAACGDDAPEEATPDAGATGTEQEVSEEDAPSGDAETFLNIATAGTAGTYYAYGGTYASIINSSLDGVEANAEATGGSVENVRLVAAGESDVGIAQADVVWDAVRGEGDFDGDAQPIRVIGGMYPNYLQLAALADGDVTTFADLQGARVSVGPAGGGQEVTLRTVTEALGSSFDEFGGVENLGFADQNLAFGDNNIDVGNYMTSMFAGAISELAATNDITFVSFSADEMATITDTAPYFIAGIIPGGVYDGVDEDIESVPGLWNWLIVHEDMDDDLAYDLTMTLYENADVLEATTPAAEETRPDNLAATTTPLHPGTLRYAEDNGIELPSAAIAD